MSKKYNQISKIKPELEDRMFLKNARDIKFLKK